MVLIRPWSYSEIYLYVQVPFGTAVGFINSEGDLISEMACV